LKVEAQTITTRIMLFFAEYLTLLRSHIRPLSLCSDFLALKRLREFSQYSQSSNMCFLYKKPIHVPSSTSFLFFLNEDDKLQM